MPLALHALSRGQNSGKTNFKKRVQVAISDSDLTLQGFFAQLTEKRLVRDDITFEPTSLVALPAAATGEAWLCACQSQHACPFVHAFQLILMSGI